jgi:hypothetical protein
MAVRSMVPGFRGSWTGPSGSRILYQMLFRLTGAACAALVAGLLTVACGSPPDKEMQQAQGALDAARAAGAEQYAADTYKAAADALGRSRDAVTQRDYRLALSQALDSRERAQDAAREAADRKAEVLGEVERTLAALATQVNAAEALAKSAQAARVPARAVADARSAIAAVQTTMQKARSAVDGQDYLGAQAALVGSGAAIEKAQADLRAAIDRRQPRQAKPGRT